jgi:lysozyme
MAFNMGIQRLLGFKNMLAALKVGDYKTAAKELEYSEAYNKAPARYARLRIQLETGVWV